MLDIKVSVVIPVYNAERYLRDALDCVVNQSLKDIEIICVDDGSTDSSCDIITDYIEKDSRIRLLHQTEQSDGAALARNLGLEDARGEYLSFLDADDLFEKDMLFKAYTRAKEFDADIVCFDAFVYNSANKMDYYTNQIIYQRKMPSADVFEPKKESKRLFQMYCGSPWNNLFRREYILRNRIRFAPVHIADDIGFVNLSFACADRVAILRERLVHYRRDAQDNQTSNYTKWPWVGYQPFCLLKQELEERGLYDTYKSTFVNSFLSHALFYLSQMKNRESFDRLYNDLRDRYLRELSAFDISDDELDEMLAIRRNWIANLSPDDYLFECTRGGSFYDSKSLFIPYTYEKKEDLRIVLYGAGLFGKDIYCKLMDEKKVDVVLWVDKNFESIFNGNVHSPKDITDVVYDFVFVAISDSQAFCSAKAFLLGIGVEKSRIIWMGERDN